MLAQRPSEVLGIAKLGQTDHIEVGFAIGLGHRLPGERFNVAGAIIAGEPVHRGDGARHLSGNLGVGSGIGALRHKWLHASPKQVARLVAKGGRRLESEGSQIEKREVAPGEHDFGIVLAPGEVADPVEYGIASGLIARHKEWRPLPKRRIGRQFGEIGFPLRALGGFLFDGQVPDLIHWQNRDAKDESRAPSAADGDARGYRGSHRREQCPEAERDDERGNQGRFPPRPRQAGLTRRTSRRRS